MHILIGGASGLIGRALVASLRERGDRVTRLVRHPATAPDEVRWLDGGPLDPSVVASADAVVGLNGASIGRIPWTRSYRSTMLWSRLTPTRTLARAIDALPAAERPLLVSASGVGFYGSRPGVRISEATGRGRGFLADLCVDWERAALLAGDRVALLRTAPVVHPAGVLKPLIALTRAGVAGPLGPGTQVWPWISLDDEVAAILHVIDHDLTGPVNLAGPTRATANDLGFAVAMRMQKPFLVPAPAFALRAALGRSFADGLLLSDALVEPDALTASGFSFRHRTVQDAVAAAIPA